jgi:hypothetical protein
VHGNQDEARRDLRWYNIKILPTLAKGSRTYNKHYERTPNSGQYCKQTLRPIFRLCISLRATQLWYSVHGRIHSMLEAERWMYLHYQLGVECSIHQDHKKLNCLCFLAITQSHLYNKDTLKGTCTYKMWTRRAHSLALVWMNCDRVRVGEPMKSMDFWAVIPCSSEEQIAPIFYFLRVRILRSWQKPEQS